MPDGPMNLGPKDERLPVKRDTLESLLVAIGPGGSVPPAAWARRRDREADRLRRLLREGGE